ncbi:RNA methyltransferase [Bauldia sp.]|uniref:RNA methyltransferase n=1 Tax=Bauldia sp. TaxID=2575872 RepID=UPI003BA9DF3E
MVAPQLGENIGTAARAMANFGLRDLRLVNPRDGWPNEKARAAASGANHVVDAARVFGSVREAVADLWFVYATTARAREVAKPVVGPHDAALHLRALADGGARSGILFGPERTGLNNEDISRADEIVTFPVDPAFSSLNIAQSVLLVGYEWRLSGLAAGEVGLPFAVDRQPAPKADLYRLFDHLEAALDTAGFFRPPEKRTHMVEALRAMLQRAQFSEQEVRTLRGVVAALEGRATRPRPGETNGS